MGGPARGLLYRWRGAECMNAVRAKVGTTAKSGCLFFSSGCLSKGWRLVTLGSTARVNSSHVLPYTPMPSTLKSHRRHPLLLRRTGLTPTSSIYAPSPSLWHCIALRASRTTEGVTSIALCAAFDLLKAAIWACAPPDLANSGQSSGHNTPGARTASPMPFNS